MAKKDVTGFVAEFPNGMMEKVLKRIGVNIPENWERRKDNFAVVTDMGRELELGFWDWDKDEQVGKDTFIVDYDDVICWA